jgi:hypothetical protein
MDDMQVESALALVEDLAELADGNPHVSLMFQQLNDLVEVLGESLAEGREIQNALIAENAEYAARLESSENFVSEIVDAIINWRETEHPIIAQCRALMLESVELRQRVSDVNSRRAWIDQATKALGDERIAENLASFLFDEAPSNPAMIRAVFEALSVGVSHG